MSTALLEIENLLVGVSNKQTLLNKINVCLNRGETAALIGESGSGKSLTAKSIMGLLPEGLIQRSGKIMFKGESMSEMTVKEKRGLLGKEIALIHQDYRGSFTPYLKVGSQMAETLRSHEKISRKRAKDQVLFVLDQMNLPAKRVYHSYPFQLSGGQIQRAAIACMMLLKPSLLICDEATSALDMISGEIVLDYLERVQKQTNCAVLYITHDLTQAYKRADYIYIMNEGTVIEEGPSSKIKESPQHHYTKQLNSSILPLPPSETEHNIRSVGNL
ncbi:oligopeptide ABC transporter ATP-binding protein [Alkalihalophilus pseudofirmus OF4]|uniref:Oligopeptide ABC transporter ATP-binding protein n=1 Tax=Alkalihalophilus pseudofirmus (strain ATCC BAA-2126 / JCM 17055 / OF4) TaxID=398511 RepID=D3FQQ1_ALKPO|nr:ABC transporter ATP-binding protein [Alkalihalophilus pseudofirmus]ADC51421.1 oligopeptide ABC transporter ATP-binding protein [Alkalihalophilus pseudofirmus OF4]